MQLAGGEPGVAAGGMYASHLVTPAEAASQNANMFVTPITNLREAAAVLARQDAYIECAAQNILSYFLRMDSVAIGKIDKVFFKEVAKAILAQKPEPTFKDIARYVLTHPVVIQSVDASAGI